MRKTYTLIAGILLTFAAFAQTPECGELFISEYVEGSSNNKALEIYNPSLSPVSLSNYRIIRWDNGNVAADQSPEGILNLPANVTMPPKSVYVIALNLTDPNGTGQSAPIDTALQRIADTLLCPGCATNTGLPRVLCFNGDDALSLEKNVGGSWIKVDIFGCIGEQPSNSAGNFNPTAGWTAMPPYSSMPTNYDSNVSGPYFLQYWTQDNTLIRKYSVKSGVTTNPATETFNPSAQWDSLPENTFTSLRWHDCECNILGLSESDKIQQVKIYPNPASDFVKVITPGVEGQIRILSITGAEIWSQTIHDTEKEIQISTQYFSKGFYLLEIAGGSSSLNQKFTSRLSIE